MVELENGFRFYHAGDTNVFGDMRLIGELYQPDLALLPIGGHYTMGPREAALAVELLGVKPRHADPLRDVPDPGRRRRSSSGRSWTPAGSADVEIHAPEPGGTVA